MASFQWRPLITPQMAEQQRRAQEKQSYYDTEDGQVTVSKALTSFLRYQVPKSYLQARLQEIRNRQEARPLLAILTCTPESFIDFVNFNPKPTTDQVYNVILNSKNFKGQERFYWKWTSEPGKWVIGLRDYELQPNIMTEGFNKIWQEIQNPAETNEMPARVNQPSSSSTAAPSNQLPVEPKARPLIRSPVHPSTVAYRTFIEGFVDVE